MTEPTQRLLSVLEKLFEIDPAPVDIVLAQCADLVGQATGAEKVDAFLHEVSSRTLVAVGTSQTAMASLQRSLGLDRLPIANGDPMSLVFETGLPYDNGHIDDDPRQPRGVIDLLGARAMQAVPIDVAGVRRGVLATASPRYDAFTSDDLALLKLTAVWTGNLVHRSELVSANEARAEEQGRRAAAEQLITVVAHDLRNLLHPINARAALMLERAQQNSRADDVVDCKRMLASTQRASALMTELLDVARIEHDLLTLEGETLDLIGLLNSVAQSLSLPKVPIEVDAGGQEFAIFADRARLQQILENILSNATKHSPPGTVVTVKVTPAVLGTREAVSILILDRGRGIAPEILPRVFDRYVTSGSSSGLGLGLYLARALTLAHGGSIELGPNHPRGTRCELVLPIQRS